MIITHVIHSYYPFIGGLERAVQYLAEEQARLKHEVHVVTSTYGAKERPKEEIINNVHIHRVKSIRFRFPHLTVPLETSSVLKKADIVHIHNQNSLFNIVIAEKAKNFGAKIVTYFMALETLYTHPNPFVKSLGPYYSKWCVKKALKLSDLILVKNLRDMEIMKHTYGIEAIYVPDGLPDYYFTLRKCDFEAFRDKYKIKQDDIFLYIGRLHKLKGPHVLIKALKYISYKNIAIVLIGPDGGYLKRILSISQKLDVKDNVYILGTVSERIKICALDSSIALVLPSITDYVEVYPMVISEAWAREKPVIASRVGGIPYRVRNGINGILIEPGSAKELAQAMMSLYSYPELAKKLGKAGKSEVKTWKEIAAITSKLYKQVLRVL